MTIPSCVRRTFRTTIATVPDAADLTEAFAGAVAELEDRGYTREQIAGHLGVKAPTLSRYVTGKAGVQVEHLPIIDTLLGERLGYVLMLAGFVEPEIDTRTRLRADRALEPGQRDALVKVYDGFVELLAARASRSGADSS